MLSLPGWWNPTTTSVYLVGAGPSLRGFDFGRLRNRTVFAINDAYKHIPFATAIVSADLRWCNRRAEDLNTIAARKILVVPSGHPLPGIHGATFLRAEYESGFSENPEYINVRGSSGYAALNIAFLLGYQQIFLLGYDYTQPKERWYQRYEWKSASTEQVYSGWAEEFGSTLPQLLRYNVTVTNVGLNSAITAFPKVGLEVV